MVAADAGLVKDSGDSSGSTRGFLVFGRVGKVILKLAVIAAVGFGLATAVERFTPRAID